MIVEISGQSFDNMQSRGIYSKNRNMTNSAALLDRGIRCLNKELGILDAERFVALLLRESFDYTEWRKNNLFVGMSIDEIIDEADKYCKENKE
ncbi:MAG: hypothetical protein LBR10_14230 [Prevotellaceae bacterium]|jgi:hypothetical protein|nr:hypothetical protein [Prevotellaceae bacterium]